MRLTKRAFLAGSGAALLSSAANARSRDDVLHRCGSVEIRPTASGGVGIYGWKELIPNDRPVFESRRGSKYIVTISFADKILEVHEKGGNGQYRPTAIWPVVTPEPYKLRGTIHGAGYQIDMKPEWYPSSNLRRKYEAYRRENAGDDLPPLPYGGVPYGHPGNPMGERKIRANWGGRYLSSAVLHGTTGYPVELCGVETSGCVRLYNEWIIDLVDRVLGGPGNAIASGLDVILTPRTITGKA